MRLLFHFLLLALVAQPALLSAASPYRPFDDYPIGPRHAGSGGTGSSDPNSLGAVIYNPAYFARTQGAYFTITPDAQTTFQDLVQQQKLKVLSMPLTGYNTPIDKNWGTEVSIVIPYQRKFPDSEDFSAYYFNGGLARKLGDRWAVGLTAGSVLGLQAGEFTAWTWGSSLGVLYYHNARRSFTAGMGVFFAGKLNYDPFAGGTPVEETLPSRIQLGFSFLWSKTIRQKVEVHVTDWQSSRFRDIQTSGAFKDRTPDFDTGIGSDAHIHLGWDFLLPFLTDAWFRTGLMTASYYDFRGANEPQVQFTLGFGAIAGGSSPGKRVKDGRRVTRQAHKEDYLFEDRLKIDLAVVDSLLPSLFNDSNNLIEYIQLSFEYRFNDWTPPPQPTTKKKKKRKRPRRRSLRERRQPQGAADRNRPGQGKPQKERGNSQTGNDAQSKDSQKDNDKNGKKENSPSGNETEAPNNGSSKDREDTYPRGLERNQDGWENL